MSASKTAPIQIDASLHASIKQIAESLTKSSGKYTTIRSVIEAAVLQAHPDLRAASGVVSDAMAAADQQSVFEQIISAVFSSGDPIEQNQSIERLEGSVVGRFGAAIKLRDLAYHLRSGAACGSLSELIQSYEDNR